MKQLLILFISILLISCSKSNIAGGSDNPDFLTGVVIASTDTPVSNLEVFLVPSDYNPQTDNRSRIKIDTTDAFGEYRFTNLSETNYTIQIVDTMLNLGGITAGVDILNIEDEQFVVSIESLSKATILFDDTLSIDSVKLSAIGTVLNANSYTSIPYEKGKIAFQFKNIPQGYYESLTIQWNDTISHISSIVIQPNENEMILPSSGISNLRPIWEFPIIVGVTDSMVSHYGGIDALKILIADHLSRTEEIFHDERFQGYFSFPLDSLYVMSGTLEEENTLPPSGFAYRVLYSPFESSTIGNWVKTNKTIVLDHSDTNEGGTFGDPSLLGFSWSLGLARNAYYYQSEEVFAENNPVSSTKYDIPSSVMSIHTNQWEEFNIALINNNGTDWSTTEDDLKSYSASAYRISIVDSINTPLMNVQYELFGVERYSRTVSPTPLLSGIATAGDIPPISSPFIALDGTLKYSNILIKLTKDSDVTYHWLPYSEVCFQWLQTKNSIFSKTIQF